MPSTCDESGSSPPFTEVATTCAHLTFALPCRCDGAFVILRSGGSTLVRRRIQTPSDATVLSVVQPEGEVVLGASPLARHLGDGPEGGSRRPGEARPPFDVGSASAADVACHLGDGPEGGSRRPGEARPPFDVGSASAADVARQLGDGQEAMSAAGRSRPVEGRAVSPHPGGTPGVRTGPRSLL
jgi:hypothetical protein